MSLLTATHPERLSEALRTADDPRMHARRQIVGLSLLSAGSMGVIALFQFGMTRHVPEAPLPMLDADKVDASGEAYRLLSTGDAFVGFVSYGVTMLLAAIGGPDRHRTHPIVPLALAGKAVADAAQAARLTRDQWVHHRAFCSWCLTAAASTFLVVPLAIGEVRAAFAARRPQRAQPAQ